MNLETHDRNLRWTPSPLYPRSGRPAPPMPPPLYSENFPTNRATHTLFPPPPHFPNSYNGKVSKGVRRSLHIVIGLASLYREIEKGDDLIGYFVLCLLQYGTVIVSTYWGKAERKPSPRVALTTSPMGRASRRICPTVFRAFRLVRANVMGGGGKGERVARCFFYVLNYFRKKNWKKINIFIRFPFTIVQ